MKNIWILGLCAFVMQTGCVNKNINLNIDAGTIKNGVFTVADEGQKMIDAQNLANGRAAFKFNALVPGYYSINLSDNKTGSRYQEIYLEPGQYDIIYRGKNSNSYPQIKTSSETQNELNFFEGEMAKGKKDIAALQALFASKKEPKTGLHLMEKMEMVSNPETFDALYKQLPADVKKTNRGKYLAEQIKAVLNIRPGKKAPQLIGKTPDGKPFHFTPKKSTKFIVLAFWKSANVISRKNNQILAQIHNQYDNKGAEVISVSSDSKPLWFSTAVKDDHMNWYNVSDLKGSQSVNLNNYNVTMIPTYMLLKSDFTIVDNDASVTALPGLLAQSLN